MNSLHTGCGHQLIEGHRLVRIVTRERVYVCNKLRVEARGGEVHAGFDEGPGGGRGFDKECFDGFDGNRPGARAAAPF